MAEMRSIEEIKARAEQLREHRKKLSSPRANVAEYNHFVYNNAYQLAQDITWLIEDREKLIRANEVMKASLSFYADTNNWEKVSLVGHANWASNLKLQDCAYFNTGGGRARFALKQVKEILGEPA